MMIQSFADADYDFVKFFSDDMGLNAINLNNIILEDDNFDEDDPETIIHVRLMACHNRSTQCKVFKKKM